MKSVLRPKVILPTIFVLAMIAALLAFGNLSKVIHLMEGFDRIYFVWYLVLMVAYTVVRGVQWHVLLRALHVRAPLRAQIFAFLMGEMAKSLPIGNYVQNYVLQRSRGADFGRTAAASTLVILTEIAVSLVGVTILGIGDWGWLRPVIIIGVAVAALTSWFLARRHARGTAPRWVTKRQWLRRALDELKQFRQGAADLLHPRVLLVEAALSVTYLTIAGAALYMVLLGLHVRHISFFAALGVYFFSLAIALIVPLPVDFGAVEISGTGALLAFGLSKSTAVGTMLIHRVLSLSSALVIALAGMIVYHDELRTALSSHRAPPPRLRRPNILARKHGGADRADDGERPDGGRAQQEQQSRSPAAP